MRKARSRKLRVPKENMFNGNTNEARGADWRVIASHWVAVGEGASNHAKTVQHNLKVTVFTPLWNPLSVRGECDLL